VCEDGIKMMQQKSSISQHEKKTQTKGERDKDGIVVKKPTLALKKNKKKKWIFYFGKKKKLVRNTNFGDERGSSEEDNKSSCHPSTTITILSLPQLHMVVVLQ
jgi:hypothetical protein